MSRLFSISKRLVECVAVQASRKNFHVSAASLATAKKFVFARRFQGLPKLSDIKLVEEELPKVGDGEILCEALYLSVDPYMRPYSNTWDLGCTMKGSQVAKVVESRNSKFPVGSLVVGYFGWRTHTVANPNVTSDNLFGQITPLPDLGDLSPSLGLGAIGMPGNSAYFGLLDICQPKAGDVVAVSGAAGAVGSLVGQIAKIKGCRVIGFAGSDNKVRWLQDELGFDKAFNYKTANLKQTLKDAAPYGINCYFDNVGGQLSVTVRSHMAHYGRIAVCGSIATYNDTSPTLIPAIEPVMVFREVRMEGFLIHRFANRYHEGLTQMAQWIKEGKIKVKETYTEGFEGMPQAFIGMLQGTNTGKAIVKV